MAKASKSNETLTACVDRARAIAVAHPAIVSVDEPTTVGSGMQFEVLVEVPMPNAWWAVGESPAGVKRFESVRLEFPPSYPLDPPELSLRADFRRDIAHIQPWLTHDDRLVPCVQDGRMSEFLHQQGIAGILNQTVLWLERAAEGRLIDPEQGWEPIRRDDVSDMLVADADRLRSIVNRDGGIQFSRMDYFRSDRWLHGQVFDEKLALNKETIKSAVKDHQARDEDYRIGKSLALFVWPGKEPSGKRIVCDEYLPDTIRNLRDLKEKARAFGSFRQLCSGLDRLKQCVSDYDPAGPFPLAVVLCARRPFNLIGSSSAIELCFYTLEFHAGNALPEADETPVRPAAHREHITPSLLARLSGEAIDGNDSPWTLIGAGSLGSKIGLHMGRAGRGPSAIVDHAMMAPHNAARHSMIPQTGDMQITSMDAKARQLRHALAGLSQEPVALTYDAAHVLSSRKLAKQAFPKGTWVIVNTTASMRVRAALCASVSDLRVFETLLYAGGQLGLIAAEGPDRNPDIGDLITEFYYLGAADSQISKTLFPAGDGDELPRVIVGEGCGSATMQVSDARISMYAAGASEYLSSYQDGGLPSNGELVIGKLGNSGLGINWDRFEVAPVVCVESNNGAKWQIRIGARAVEKIQQEIGHWPDVETGGVLVGRQDEATQTFYVVDVLPAPEDSDRSPNEFVLGTKGLRTALEDYTRATNVTLYCLGTWHSHLTATGPSALDRQSALALSLARLAPSVMLIHTPTGYKAILADQTSQEGFPT